MSKLGLYIHWPYCVSKCPYCDFASRPLPDGLEEGAFAAAYEAEMAFYAAQTGPRLLSSLYFGGGTPSLMKPETVAWLIAKAGQFWPLAAACEITLEANPSSADREKFRALREAGVNRLSLGVQSFDDKALRFLGRAHDAKAARRAIEEARKIFPRFSFDLIYAYAGQTPAAWKKELNEALSFGPKHVSLYQLTVEPGTVFYKQAKKEKLQADEEVSADLFDATQEILAQAGLPAYEISNHAAPGEESRHNLIYWHYEDYIGLGPAAHGRFVGLDGARHATAHLMRPEKWLAQTKKEGRGVETDETLGQKAAQREALMMGARLAEGISRERWKNLFGEEIEKFLPPVKTEFYVRENLIENTSTHFRATAEGRKKLNALLGALFAET